MARSKANSKKNAGGKRLIDRVVPMDQIKKATTPKRTPVKAYERGI